MRPCPDQAIVPDDKAKKYMWLLPVWLYQHLLWHFALVAKTWHVSCLSVQVANEWCLTVLHCLLSDRMKKFICFRRYRCVLPYTYGTFKAKCFRDGLHTCQRAGHSCMRKIVSFAGWPSRRRWRFVHKALETLVRSFVMSDEVWGLKDVCKVMDSRMSTACAHTCRSFTCGRCGKTSRLWLLSPQMLASFMKPSVLLSLSTWLCSWPVGLFPLREKTLWRSSGAEAGCDFILFLALWPCLGVCCLHVHGFVSCRGCMLQNGGIAHRGRPVKSCCEHRTWLWRRSLAVQCRVA